MDVAVSTESLASQLFPDLDLGDARRDKRFARVVEALAQRAGRPLPEIFPDPAEYDAALRLFHTDNAPHAQLLAAHQCAVLDRLETISTPVLLLHDATVLNFSGHTTLEDDLGPVGDGGGRGWIAHQSLAVDPANRVVHGLVGRISHVRPESTKGESVAERRSGKRGKVASGHGDWTRSGRCQPGVTGSTCATGGRTCSSSWPNSLSGNAATSFARATIAHWGRSVRTRRPISCCTTRSAGCRRRPIGPWKSRPKPVFPLVGRS